MILIVSQRIKIKNSRIPYSIQKKYGEQSIIPRIGDKLEDSVWKDPYEYEVIEVLFNYQENLCYIELAPFADEIPEEKMEEFAKMVKAHGWSTSWGSLNMTNSFETADDLPFLPSIRNSLKAVENVIFDNFDFRPSYEIVNLAKTERTSSLVNVIIDRNLALSRINKDYMWFLKTTLLALIFSTSAKLANLGVSMQFFIELMAAQGGFHIILLGMMILFLQKLPNMTSRQSNITILLINTQCFALSLTGRKSVLNLMNCSSGGRPI